MAGINAGHLWGNELLDDPQYFTKLITDTRKLPANSTIKTKFPDNLVMTGGGALVRGSTLRRLVQSGRLEQCVGYMKKDWCWWHADWVLAECFHGIGVQAEAHPAFQQFSIDNKATSFERTKDA